ncbi:MG2 domain-containing protein [Flectobacillus sp. DC10W]|uniref:MG2 domain-containing protein n=1 Tax=Flectobacillus longus TaxID=2984207 RepID=A0ABT6YSQ7_9BACT|nr:MG2 domain-containing protein [Flectobacillus longus]MDI9866633.1 MG2 domain-containing protein [Flectobacillus longus]
MKAFRPSNLLVQLSFFFLLILSSCSHFGDVTISGTNFEEEINQTQNLVFTFNKDLVPLSELNTWYSTDYIEFSPKVEGRFKWTAPNELVFSPAVGFDPATEYTAEVNKLVLHKASEKYDLDTETLKFHTPYLALDKTESYWAKSSSSTQGTAILKLHFNYAVNPQEVAKLLKITGEKDQEVKTQIVQTDASSLVLVRIQDDIASQGGSLKVSIDKGLSLPSSRYATSEAIESDIQLSDPGSLEIQDVEHGFSNNKGYIKVLFNQAISPESISNAYQVSINGSSSQNEETVEAVIEYDSLGNPIQKVKEAPKKTDNPKVDTKYEVIENGFVISGDFNESDTYLLELKTQLKSVLGVNLSDSYTKDVYFGQMPASLAFVNKKATYLSSKGHKNIALNIVNIPRVNVKIAKIYENNILNFLRQNRYQDYDYENENGGNNKSFVYYEDESGLYSDILVNKMVETTNLPKSKGVHALNLSLPDQNNLKGIYLVSVNSTDEYYQNATKLVSISDIGLITKQADDELFVFANSIKTTEPISNVEIALISTNNQTIQKLTTDSKGVAVFKDFKKSGFKVAMLTAHTSDDFNYLFLEDTQVETSRFEVEGKRSNVSGFEAFMYGDRDIYRPGETINLNTIIRTNQWKSVGRIPIKLRILMPNGKEWKSFHLETNEQGAVALSIPTERSNVTGTYILEVLNGNDIILASRNISIEEFMPDRIKVDVNTNKPFYRTGEVLQVNATATNLFGPPASNRNYEMEMKLSRKVFQPKGFENFVFDVQDNTAFEGIMRQGVTNENGIASENFQLPATMADMGVIEAKTYVTVFDETGRPVNRLKKSDIFTQNVFYGIGLNDTYLSTNSPVQIPLVALNKDAQGVSTQGKVEIVRFDYQTVIEKNSDNSLKYTSKKQTKVVYGRMVDFSQGKASINFVPTISGEYEIRVHRNGAKTWTAQTFYAYSWGSTENSSFEVNTEGQVTMTFDKEKYQTGDKVKVLFKTPFAGKLLVTIERNKVLEYHYLDTDKKSAELSFKVDDEHLPNVYVSATLIRPLDDSNMPLTVAHGYAPVMVEEEESRLPIEIAAVERSRSKTSQIIKVKTKANTAVTIAVVDEGILQLKNFKTPDPHAHFYQKQALEVNSYDLYPFLLPEIAIRQSSSMGGDGYDLEKRVNPLTNGRVNLVAIWSGEITTNSNGEASLKVDIPQFSGDLRIMAIGYKDEAFGSATKNMKVADPLVISTALPRFASPNDEIQVPVNITNTTKQNAVVLANIATSGGLAITTTRQQKVVVPAEKEARVYFSVKAAPVIGLGKVVISVNGLKEKFTESTELSIRPSTSLLKTSSSGVIAANQSKSITSGTESFIPSSVSSQLILSKSPMVQFIDKFEHLLGYPYGCIEQVTSKAFPQLYFKDFVGLIQKGKKPLMKSGENELNPNTNIMAAIHKIETQQLPNGGLAYWTGSDKESWWGSIYACHFLIEAQKADYEININTLGRLLEYINNRSNKKETETASLYDPATGSSTQSTIASRENIYGLYVLALSGKPNRAVMNYYKANQQLLSLDERYLLAGAFAQIGDPKSQRSIMPNQFVMNNDSRQSGGNFNSPIRELALTLNTLVDVDPQNLQIPVLARLLSQSIATQKWLSTQEEAFSFLALGKIARKAQANQITASVRSGKQIGNFSGADLLMKNLAPTTSVSTKGKGALYYFLSSEGLSANSQFVQEDNFLQVRRTYYTRSGQVIGQNRFKQNQLIVVKVTLSSQVPTDNIVITDMLPAGFEIENPRLNADRELTWLKDQASPEHFDIRDDRINFFTGINGTSKSFYYLVRAVSKGKFTQGPVSADAMYNADLRSYHGAGSVTVE